MFGLVSRFVSAKAFLVIALVTSLNGLLCVSGALALELDAYPQGRSIISSETNEADYRLTLGSMEKINSVWVAENERRLKGKLSRNVLELSPEYSAEEAFQFYRQQLIAKGGRELFACEAWRCGSSNAWANVRFGVRQLYGLDQYQYYTAFQVDDADTGRQVYVALYSVTRGTRRSYVLVDQLVSDEPASKEQIQGSMAGLLKAGQAWWLPGEWSTHGKELVTVARLMQDNPEWNVAIVGVDFNKGGLQQQQQRSRLQADSIVDDLIRKGVDGSRLKTVGFGGLLPKTLAEGQTQGVYLIRFQP